MNFLPIMLLASERSGTNLLRAILSSHSKIAAPPPCGVVDIMLNHLGYYFSHHGAHNFDALIEDSITITKIHMNPWDVTLSPQLLREKMENESFWQLFKVMNDVFAEAKGCSCWFSKETGLFDHIYEIYAHIPQAKFIYMVRDGRDVASSMLRGGEHANDIYRAAMKWSTEQSKCLYALSDPLIRDRAFILKYEDLIQRPESVVFQIMEFLGLKFEPGQLKYYEQKEIKQHAKSSAFWEQVSSPVNSDNSGGYKKGLSAFEIAIFENVARRQMEILDYSLESAQPVPVTNVKMLMHKISSLLKNRKKRFMSQEELEKRAQRSSTLQTILQERSKTPVR